MRNYGDHLTREEWDRINRDEEVVCEVCGELLEYCSCMELDDPEAFEGYEPSGEDLNVV